MSKGRKEKKNSLTLKEVFSGGVSPALKLTLEGIRRKGKMKMFASEIFAVVRAGKLRQAFNAATVKKACLGWAERTYHVFLAKHAVGNGKTTELFLRVDRGLYRLNHSR